MTTVLMTADTVGGVWTYALDLADALASYDVTVRLATMGPRMTAAQRDAVQRSAVASVHESDFALEWMADPWQDVDAAGEWLLDLADRLDVDLVHLNGYVHAALSWRRPVVVVAHSDVVSWWHAVHGSDPPGEWDSYRHRVAEGLHAADVVVTPTAAVADDLSRHYAVADTVVVPNSRRPAQTPALDKQPLVVGAGRIWDEAKNLAALQRIAPRLPWPVELAGPTDLRDVAADHARPGAGIRNNAKVTGELGAAELAELLGRASVFVAPARYEPFGLGALEAAQAGCALVLGDIPSLREVWADAASYVDPNDDDAFVAAVTQLTVDDDLRARLADAARARAASYTPERTARGYLDVYARLPVKGR